MEVEPGVLLIFLGDLNGRLKVLEPLIEIDSNGRMIEEWSEKFELHHLNLSNKCIRTYIFEKEGGRRSAVDHMIVNSELMEKFKGMHIDEDRIALNKSDHNLVRAWFNIGKEEEARS